MTGGDTHHYTNEDEYASSLLKGLPDGSKGFARRLLEGNLFSPFGARTYDPVVVRNRVKVWSRVRVRGTVRRIAMVEVSTIRSQRDQSSLGTRKLGCTSFKQEVSGCFQPIVFSSTIVKRSSF